MNGWKSSSVRLHAARCVWPVLLVLALSFGAAGLHAQIPNCNCAKVGLRVDADVACRATFLITYEESGEQFEVTVNPGAETAVTCERGLSIAILECGTTWRTIPVGGCLYNLRVDGRQTCCVDACLIAQDAVDCWEVVVRNTITMPAGCGCSK